MFASREISDKEKKDFMDVNRGNLEAYSLGQDEIVIAANAQSLQSNIKELSPTAVCHIFTDNTALSWNDVPEIPKQAKLPKNEVVKRFIRKETSGTASTFDEKLLKEKLHCPYALLNKSDPATNVKEELTNQAIHQALLNTPFSIGFLSKSFLQNTNNVYEIPIIRREDNKPPEKITLPRQVLMYVPVLGGDLDHRIFADQFVAFLRGKGRNPTTIDLSGLKLNDKIENVATCETKSANANEYILPEKVYFDFDSFEPSPSPKNQVQSLISELSNDHNAQTGLIKVYGYTDSVGSKDANLLLAQRRAERVAGLLWDNKFNVYPENVLGIGLRQSKNPEDPESLAADRFVEIHIMPSENINQ